MGLLWKCFIVGMLAFSLGAQAAPTAAAKKKITLGSKTFEVELAQSPAEHEKGLMFRSELKGDEGMLFIFKTEETRFFWMKNTLADLSIGYFNKKSILIDVQEMKMGKGISDDRLPSYPSAAPAMYALEMRKGWFDENKIKLGTKLVMKH